MKRLSLEALTRLQLARIAVQQGRSAEALTALEPVQSKPGATISPELEAQVRLLRSSALARSGRSDAAREERTQASRLLDVLRQRVPPEYRTEFEARPAVSQMPTNP
jgi:predicted negative regulator of RcsB-dependent stress response